jgi:hypothetical protein
MKKDYSEREKYENKKSEVKNPVKDGRRDKSGSEKYADKIPTPQGTRKE